MERSRILEKIQKALNLANDAGATPGEAAAALNSAQNLMVKYGVEETELGMAGMGRAEVKISMQAGKKVPMSLSLVISRMRKCCGVEACVNREIRISDPSWVVEYFGPQHRVEMACYLHHVLTRSIEKGWVQHLRTNPHLKGERGAKTGYYAGWVSGVSEKLHQFVLGEGEAKTLKLYMESCFGGELGKAKTSRTQLDGSAVRAGQADARGFQVHRPVNGQELRKIA